MSEVISATEFKAKCLEILDQVAAGCVDRVVITKRGKPVGVLIPPGAGPDDIAGLYGCLRDSTIIDPEVDLTEPVSEPFDAEDGLLHR
jgi:prevent-host-death family protein